MHPYAKFAEGGHARSQAKARVKAYAKGGKVHSDEAEDKKLFKKMINEHEKGETKVEGHASGGRLDRYARGGKTKGHKKGGTHVKIAIVNKDKDQGAMPPMMPPGMPPPGGGMPPGLPPGPGGPPGLPPGGPPGMPPMKRGGKVPMKAGAKTGEGRLDKKKAYGAKARG